MKVKSGGLIVTRDVAAGTPSDWQLWCEYSRKRLAFITALSPNRSISGIVNSYTKVLEIKLECQRTVLKVSSTTGFQTGDRVLIVQMKGADIDISNTSTFGTVRDYRNTGNYELASIAVIDANDISLQKPLLRSYDPNASVQLVSVPVSEKMTIANIVTAKPWDGSSGGIVVLQADTLDFQSNIDVSYEGFRAGRVSISVPMNTVTDYYFSFVSQKGGEKGEGIVEYQSSFEAGRGPLANGGGGGNAVNTGGGGGWRQFW